MVDELLKKIDTGYCRLCNGTGKTANEVPSDILYPERKVSEYKSYGNSYTAKCKGCGGTGKSLEDWLNHTSARTEEQRKD